MVIEIREAEKKDSAVILGFIKELADYEKLSHEVAATEELITEHLFGANKCAYSTIAEVDGKPVGFTIYFFNYSTFLGRPGIYLEDLYVKPEYRGLGVGKALLINLARLAVQKNCGRFEWAVLDWNEPAIKFYQKVGAISMEEWVVQRLTGEALHKFAQQSVQPLDEATSTVRFSVASGIRQAG